MLVWKSRVPVSVGSRQWRLMKSTVARSRTRKTGRFLHVHGNDIARVVAGEQQDHRALLAGLLGDGRIRRFGPFAARAGVVKRTNAHRGCLRRGGERGVRDQRAGGRNSEVDVRRVRQGDEDTRLIDLVAAAPALGRPAAAATPSAGRRRELLPGWAGPV